MYISEKIEKIIKECEQELSVRFQNLDDICYLNSQKVLKAFNENRIAERHFNSTTGYGYNDDGRDAIEMVFAHIFKAEDALVRNQFISGTHALSTTLFGILRPNDLLLSITGKPYDTLDEVIGIKENASSLKSFGVKYAEIDLIDNDFDYDKIREFLQNNDVKMIEIQRSRGYSTRESISIQKLEKVIKFIKEIDEKVIIMIDNCYCEFVADREPIEIGADIAVGSLIKNLGGGIASNGAYVVGKKALVDLVAERLTAPGLGKEVGPSQGANKMFLQGIYMAPLAVINSVKIAYLTSLAFEKLGYNVNPTSSSDRADIVQTIIFEDREKMIKYCQGIQKGSAIDSEAVPQPAPMPGYDDDVIMASGSFTQGSSIEISCDGPLRSPFIAYQQGSLTYEYGKIALGIALSNMED